MTADKIRVKYSQVCSEHITVIKSSKPTEHLQFTGGHGTQKLPTGKFIICQWKDWWSSVFTDWLFTSEPGSRVSPLRHHQLSPTDTGRVQTRRVPKHLCKSCYSSSHSKAPQKHWITAGAAFPSVPACPEQRCCPGMQDRATWNPRAARQISIGVVLASGSNQWTCG